MNVFQNLEPKIRSMLTADLIIGPALSSLGQGGLDPSVCAIIRNEVKRLMMRVWPRPRAIEGYNDTAVPVLVVENGLCESVASTATYLSHLRLGYLEINQEMVHVATCMIEHFIDENGVDPIVALGLVVSAYDDYQLLRHYGTVPEDIFVSGEWHRPWIPYTLESELDLLIGSGRVERVEHMGQTMVKLTEVGEAKYQEIRALLRETGYLQRRWLLNRLSEFSRLENYDEIMNRLVDTSARDILLEKSGIEPGMRVLELGCGTGALTLDCGMHEMVGSYGHIVATDPSIGMLVRAKRKLAEREIINVEFIQAPAERIPFKDNSFDAVTGFAFLHFTDIPAVMKEVHRVSKPNAIFSTVFALSFPRSNDFFVDWFKPVLGTPSAGVNRDIFPGRDTASSAMQGLFTDIEVQDFTIKTYYRDPESVVLFLVQVVNAFDVVMNELPWKARQDMVQHLMERGRDIVKTYSEDQLVQHQPSQLIKGRVLKM